jgi:hypothetical protein
VRATPHASVLSSTARPEAMLHVFRRFGQIFVGSDAQNYNRHVKPRVKKIPSNRS